MNCGLRRRAFATILSAVLWSGAAAAAGPAPAACDGPGIPLDVEVTDLRSTHGNLTVTVYGDRPADFLAAGRKLVRKRVAIPGPTTAACLPVPRAGTYAVAVYHDEDGDHDFDRTLLGLPAEGYGFSNDAPALVGLPSFEDARVEVPAGGARLTIRMRY